MTGHLWKLALVVALSHGYRVVGRSIGPRWAGLITALPCSTAISLLGGGSDRGVDYAVAMADACWVGLAGASALPLAFASATVAGWGWVRSVLLAVLAYFAVMVGVGSLAHWSGGNFPIAVLALMVATFQASRIPEPSPSPRSKSRSFSAAQVFWLRTAVPAACLMMVIVLGERMGPSVAGCLGTFPGVTLTALLLTRLEAGPVPAVRMARALPPGNWAMVAFLATFMLTAPRTGVVGGTALGYLSALVCLGTVARLTNPPMLTRLRGLIQARRRQLRPERATKINAGPAWPRTPRRFSPLVEPIIA